jgi:hypothetical protein
LTASAGWVTTPTGFSDVVGAAFLGAGTTELLLYLHRQHEQQPGRCQLFPDIIQPTTTSTSLSK